MTSIAAPVQGQPFTNFLVVQPNNQYTVSVTVTYQGVGGGPWKSTVKFTSGPIPTYTYLGQVRKINGQPVAPPVPTVNAVRGALLFVNAEPLGMGIEAQTSMNFPGNYMLMQLTSTLRQYTDGTNTYQLANTANNPNNTFQAFDNGAFGGTTNKLGMSVGQVSNYGELSNQWTQDNQTSQDYVAIDDDPQNLPSPQTQPPSPTIPTQVSVGALNGGAGGNETFTTYLMYQPPEIAAQWVAIGQVTWGWGGTASVQNGSFVQPVLSPNTGPVNPQTLPLKGQGPNATLPLWNTTTTAIVAAGWQKK